MVVYGCEWGVRLLIGRKYKRIFWSDGNVGCFDWDVGYRSVYVCEKLIICLRFVNFVICEVYFKIIYIYIIIFYYIYMGIELF